LYDALHRLLTGNHRFMLELHLGQHDALGKAIARIDEAVDAATVRMDEEEEPTRPPFDPWSGCCAQYRTSVSPFKVPGQPPWGSPQRR
jgi:hypothetical protein